MLKSEDGFLPGEQFDMTLISRRDNKQKEALKKFSLCLDLGHIPVSKVNSTVNNRRVSIFGDQSVIIKDEIGMTRNVFYGFYSKFNLPPDVDPNSLSLSISGQHSVTLSGDRYQLNVINTKRLSKFPALNTADNNDPVVKQKLAFLENYSEQNVQPKTGSLSNAPEQQAPDLKPSPTDTLKLEYNLPLPQDTEEDFPPPPPELLYSSSMLVGKKARQPTGIVQPLIDFFENEIKNNSPNPTKPEPIPKVKVKKFPRVSKRYRKSKRETNSVGTQTEPMQMSDIVKSRNENKQYNMKSSKESHYGTMGQLYIPSNDSYNLRQYPAKHDTKIYKSELRDIVLETQAQDKRYVIRTNPEANLRKVHPENKQRKPTSYPQATQFVPVNLSRSAQRRSEPQSQAVKDFSEIRAVSEEDFLTINPSDKNHIPKSYLRGRQIPQEIPLDMWINYLREPN
ncbi:uncharacterized protein LOC125485467 [Rhincodon typus]|uniref:uncharacterized protein LOC125485467 n=1 Tax=Rhincodon typus TaxID=259920 RepID=UPI002030065E|nr:uncharacterized protein LOC125485467 [Rhincodon typus]XP_048464367.1 uncharacterized protein LOC125485467 [Rhincodon typus]XP_048464368.1 uncharacterized protein LOC125485467 [Rhincodon typus]